MTTTMATARLTQLRLNPRHRDVSRDLADVDRMHRRIMSLFPDDLGDNARANARVLYRLDHEAQTVLIQSSFEASLDKLPTGYATGATRDLTPLLETLDTHLPVRFRIVANPTSIHTQHGKKHRYPLRGDDAVAWWHRRAEQAGLAVSSTLLTREERLTGARHTSGHGSRRFHHDAAQFDGTATIADPTAVRHAILDGIGRAKSYGCGLLSLHPTGSPS